jgi:hypothetical protein
MTSPVHVRAPGAVILHRKAKPASSRGVVVTTPSRPMSAASASVKVCTVTLTKAATHRIKLQIVAPHQSAPPPVTAWADCKDVVVSLEWPVFAPGLAPALPSATSAARRWAVTLRRVA